MPLIVGAAVLAGAAPAAWTTSLADETAELEPPAFDAVTVTRSRLPWSPGVRMRICAFSPGMSTHEAPSALHRCHW